MLHVVQFVELQDKQLVEQGIHTFPWVAVPDGQLK